MKVFHEYFLKEVIMKLIDFAIEVYCYTFKKDLKLFIGTQTGTKRNY